MKGMIPQTQNFSVRQIAELKAAGLITLGGHRKLKIYGSLNCTNAARYVAKGQYIQQRVLFASEQDAVDNGFRPCGCCMKEEYKVDDDPIKSYRNYYIKDKVRFAKWEPRAKIPSWFPKKV